MREENRYSLVGTPAYEQYRGCGHGVVIINKKTDIPVEMYYGVEKPSGRQNVDLLTDGRVGKVLWGNKEQIAYIANFSCTQACLF